MSKITFDQRLRATRILYDRDYTELCSAIALHGATRNRKTKDLAFGRIMDILNPTIPAQAPVVPIASLAQDASA